MGLLRAIAKAVVAEREKHPFMQYLSDNNAALAAYLSTVSSVLRKMGPDGRAQVVAAGPKGILELIREVTNEYFNQSPELDRAAMGIVFERDNPQQKLRFMAAWAGIHIHTTASEIVSLVNNMMISNPDRIATWSGQINSPQDMLDKIGEWKNRGLI